MPGQTAYTENELVDALKKRDNAAYRYLYLNYRGSLFNVVVQIVPDTETANDVLQEIFITVWKNIDQYSAEKGRLYTWLLNLTRNMAINKTRSRGYKNFLKNDSISNYVNIMENNSATQLNINTIGIRKEVSKLKEDHRQVLELSYFQGFTQEEISKTLKIPVGTIKSRMRSAIRELRKQFN